MRVQVPPRPQNNEPSEYILWGGKKVLNALSWGLEARLSFFSSPFGDEEKNQSGYWTCNVQVPPRPQNSRTHFVGYSKLCANFFRGQGMIRTPHLRGNLKLTRTLRFSANANEFRPTPRKASAFPTPENLFACFRFARGIFFLNGKGFSGAGAYILTIY